MCSKSNRVASAFIQAVIQKCRKEDQDDRPSDQQQWCLYTKDRSRLLGRHPSKEKAREQEKAVQYFKHREAQVERTWREIQAEYEEKYGKNHHCLKLECIKCGDQMTCRCSKPKTLEKGICYYCTGEIER